MYELRLPMKTSELNILTVANPNEHETILGIGIGHEGVFNFYQWLYRIHKPYKLLVENRSIDEISEFIETAMGLWQLRVLANFGEGYTNNLRKVLLRDSPLESFTILEFARAVHQAIPKVSKAMDVDYLFAIATTLTQSRYNLFHPISLDYPEATRSPIVAVNVVVFSVIQLTISMIYQITEKLQSILEDDSPHGQLIKDSLVILANDINAHASDTFGPLNGFADEVLSKLKQHKSNTIKTKQKNLGLKLL